MRRRIAQRIGLPDIGLAKGSTLKNILVTGAYGFLGRHVARHYANENWRVIGLGRGSWTKSEAEAWGIETWLAGDVDSTNLDRAAAFASGSIDAIFHAAGTGSVQNAQSDPLGALRQSVLSTGEVLDFLRVRAPGARLVFPSSAAVYGIAAAEPLSEGRPLAPVSIYGAHKAMCESLIVSYVLAFGLKATIVRYFSIFGRGLRKQLVWEVCQRLERNRGKLELFGDGGETRDMIHVDDASTIAWLGVECVTDPLMVVNGATGKAVTVRTIAAALSNLMNGAEPKFTGVTRPGDPRHYEADIRKLEMIGFVPRWSLEDGLADYVNWWCSQREDDRAPL